MLIKLPLRSRVKTVMLLGFALLALGLSGCQYNIKFEDIGYTIENKQYDAGLVAVITPQTIAQTVTVRSFMTGIAHSWDAQPGEMLRQVAEVEFPQMFRHYRMVSEYEEPQTGVSRMTVDLSVAHYAFSDFHTTVVVHAVAYRPGRVMVFDKSYREEGETQGGKMFWGGAFAMKSAIRQSSFDAYKKIFAQLRTDMAKAMESSPQ